MVWELTMLLLRCDVLLTLDVGNRTFPIWLLFRSKHADRYATDHAEDQGDTLGQLYVRLGGLFARAIYCNKSREACQCPYC